LSSRFAGLNLAQVWREHVLSRRTYIGSYIQMISEGIKKKQNSEFISHPLII